MQQGAVADEAAVDEDENRIAVGFLHLRPGEEAGEAEGAQGRVVIRAGFAAVFRDGFGGRHGGRRQEYLFLAHADIHQLLEHLAAEDLVNALLQRGHGGDVQQLGGAAGEAKGPLRVRQAVVGGERRDVGQLGLLGAQEFSAGGHVIEEVAHGDGGAAAERGFFAAQHLAAGDFDARAGGLLGGAGFEQQARDGCDGGQRLAAEPQGGDREQVLDIAQLAGGMALEGQQRVVAQHAAAVVQHADEPPAARFDFHPQVRRAGVEGVFEKFLDHRRRPLDHFSGGDLVGDLVGKNANAAHDAHYSLAPRGATVPHGSPSRKPSQPHATIG